VQRFAVRPHTILIVSEEGHTMELEKVMVVGAGQMGTGIAQVFAQAEFTVLINDISTGALEKGMASIDKRLASDVEQGRIDAKDKSAALNRLSTSTQLKDAETCDLVIEAVVEDIDTKTDVMQTLDQYAPEHAILASNNIRRAHV